MPVPQTGTATSVVSTGTKEVARSGIEAQSVLAAPGLVKPHSCKEAGTRLALGPATH
jgi:hypothetical protein